MIGRTNLFQEVHCPLYLIGKCDRPFCHYKHVARISELKASISYSTTESADTSSAYLGFFDGSNDQRSTEIQQNFDEDEFCASLIEDAKDISTSSMELNQNEETAAELPPSATKVETFKSMLDQKKTEIDRISTNLANNPSDVQDLLQKLSSLNESIKILQGQLVGSKEAITLQGESSNPQSHFPVVSTTITYKPTPIQELEKRRKSQVVQHQEPKIAHIRQPKAGGTLKIEQINHVASSSNNQRRQTYTSKETKKRQNQRSDDYSGWRPEVVEKSVRFLERVTEYAAPVEKSEDLNSLINDLLLPTKNQPKLNGNVKIDDKTREAKRKNEEKLSKSEPSIKKTKKYASKLKEIDLFDPSTSKAHEEKSGEFSNFSEPKKRVSRISSEKDASSSKVNEENIPRGKGLMILTPHEQLKMRFERMQKEKAEILRRQAENMQAKEKPATSSNSSSAEESKTAAGTVQKGEKRVQHHFLPNTPTSRRPVVLFDSSAKVPSTIRQRYLNVMIDHCLKYCRSEQAAYDLAVEQENNVYKKSNSKAAYLNAAVNAIKRLRDDFDDERPKSTNANTTASTLSHNDVLLGKVDKNALTLRRSAAVVLKSAGTIQGKEFYDRLRVYTLTDAQLNENGFPRSSDQCPSKAEFRNERSPKYVSDDETKRICCRCGKEFHIVFNCETSEYTYMGSNDCVYHWGKAWKKRVAGAIESRYTCCQSDLATKGCCLAKFHVTDTMPSSFLEDFINTQAAENPNHSVYSVDCEMVYTTLGCELARVTVVNEKCQVVYDKIVKPSQPLLDCNSRFSGLTEKQLLSSKYTLQSVRQEILKMIDESTILLGHSLESDLKSMKIIHKNVVDTSIVFPHRMGLPYKRALKTLMLEFLEKIIQDEVEGHDSKEDACSCMQLMKWKVREDNSSSRK